ncbi:MAG TPA: hypothetical protein P5534_18630, partial [Candidatus Paceibacterota bacterium]|nr:hypothetical protein [Candidatus Paceibacterota bacterium]
NVAGDPRLAGTRERLAAQLTDYLKRTGDPRESGSPAEFDSYPYIGGVVKWPGEDTIREHHR